MCLILYFFHFDRWDHTNALESNREFSHFLVLELFYTLKNYQELQRAFELYLSLFTTLEIETKNI